MSLFPELRRATPKELLRWFSERNGAHDPDDEELWLHEAAVKIAESGLEGVRFLLSNIPGAASNRLRAILIGLSHVQEKKLLARCQEKIWIIGRRLLRDERPMIVAEAVDLLNQTGCTAARAEILKLRKHDSPFVVGSVLRYLARHCPEKAEPLLHQALTSKEAIVRQNAIDELDELNCVSALPAIQKLLRDKDRWVRRAARTAVRNLKDARSREGTRTHDRKSARTTR